MKHSFVLQWSQFEGLVSGADNTSEHSEVCPPRNLYHAMAGVVSDAGNGNLSCARSGLSSDENGQVDARDEDNVEGASDNDAPASVEDCSRQFQLTLIQNAYHNRAKNRKNKNKSPEQLKVLEQVDESKIEVRTT